MGAAQSSRLSSGICSQNSTDIMLKAPGFPPSRTLQPIQVWLFLCSAILYLGNEVSVLKRCHSNVTHNSHNTDIAPMSLHGWMNQEGMECTMG